MAQHKFTTDVFSAAYPALDKPATSGQYPSGMYEVTAFMTESENADGIMSVSRAIEAAAKEAFGSNFDLETLNSTGIKKTDDGALKVLFKSKFQPKMQGPDARSLPPDVVIGYGDKIRAAGHAWAWSRNNGRDKGITLMLSSIRLIEKAPASDDFGGPEDGYEFETADEFGGVEETSVAIKF
jgi:hypothetical protein